MESELRIRAKEIFLDLIEAEPKEREGLLRSACGADAALRSSVLELIGAHDEAGDFLGSPTIDGALPGIFAEGRGGLAPGDRVGVYRVLSPLGEGGFGAVYLAEQEEPIVRQVALKVVRPGMEIDSVVARFEAERQSLALMDHPGIARVFDAGATESGSPYFVMEYVRGQAVTDFCDRRRLSIRERLVLFVEICRAVQHAHQKGVIHRDLKPPNVLVALVDGKPMPKVIDFGVAKAVGAKGFDQSLTGAFQVVGTPEFMSPEQTAGSDDLDTRTDVYSLGVVLYSLLTGVSPYQAATGDFVDLARAIREDQPARPSIRVARLGPLLEEVSHDRRCPRDRFERTLRGDLDWIVMRAMEKDRARRYQSVDALASDVERYLADEPVDAGPPSAAYRLRKLYRRHRVAFLASAAALVVLIGALVLTALAALVAQRSRAEMGRALALAEQRGYVANIQLAQAALEDHDGRMARRSLDAAPAARRGWEWAHLDGRIDRSLAVFDPGSAKADDIFLHPEGTHVACHWIDGTIYVLDGTTAEVVARWNADESGGVAITGTAELLVTGARDGDIRLWDWSGVRLGALAGHTDRVAQLHVGPRAERLYSCSWDGTVRVWDLETREVVAVLEHEAPVVPIAVSDDESRLVSATWAQDLVLWDLATHERIAELRAARPETLLEPVARFRRARIGELAVSPDSTRFLAGARDGNVTLWSLADGEKLWEYGGHRELIRELAWSPDGTRFATASWDRTATLWAADTLALVAVLRDHLRDVRHLTFSPDSRLLATASWDRSLKLHDARRGTTLATLLGHDDLIFEVGFLTPLRLATYCEDGTVRIWSLEEATRETLLWGDAFVTSVAFLDDDTLLSGQLDGPSLLWDLREAPPTPRALEGADRAGRGILVQPSTDLLVTAGDRLRVWRASTRELLQELEIPEDVNRVALSTDGGRLAVSNKAGRIRVHDLTAAAPGADFQAHEGEVLGVAFLPDGRLASAGDDRVLRIWSPEQVLLEERTVASRPRAMALSPDGGVLALGKNDREVELIDVATLETRAILEGHGSFVDGVAWLPDGSRVISCGGDATVRIWDPTTGENLAALTEIDRTIYSVAVSPDGRRIAGSTAGGEIRIWSVGDEVR